MRKLILGLLLVVCYFAYTRGAGLWTYMNSDQMVIDARHFPYSGEELMYWTAAIVCGLIVGINMVMRLRR